MEKLDYLVWAPCEAARLVGLLGLPGLRGLTAQLATTVANPTILLGRGADLGALIQVWLSSYDDRRPVEDLLTAIGPVDGYLVTESEPLALTDRDWPDGQVSPGISHVTWFPKPDGLTEEEFLHGWHVIHTPHSAALHPLRWTYTRDTVVRTLTPGSPPVRAVVVERFRELRDYTDPKRLFGGSGAFEQNMRDLPGYAELDDISATPMAEVVLRTRA